MWPRPNRAGRPARPSPLPWWWPCWPRVGAFTPGDGAGHQVMPAERLPRALHPMAWWVWAIGLATAASRTTNPLMLLTILAVAGYVVAARRTDAPWARAFHYYLALGLGVIAIRVVFRSLLGADGDPSAHVLLHLPQI